MDNTYKEIINYMLKSGKKIVSNPGTFKDSGVKKQHVTEMDLEIEQGLKRIIKKHCPSHGLYAEEENTQFTQHPDIWVVDPISGTNLLIEGKPHYAIAVAHIKDMQVQFGAVYDPSMDELFSAYLGKGAFLNSRKIRVSNGFQNVVFHISLGWKDKNIAKRMNDLLSKFSLSPIKMSQALDLCHVACGRYDGVVSFCKDVYPIFAGNLIIREAGGKHSNIYSQTPKVEDRVFVGGNENIYQQLLKLVRQVM